MAKNTGKASEQDFENRLSRLGKRAYFYRFKDASDIRGLTGKIGHIDQQPSDYITVIDGETAFSEVKSTQNKTSFPFSLLRSGQNAHAVRIVAAGGKYLVYVHDLNTNQWYRVPKDVIEMVKLSGKSSIAWYLLEQYKWDI